MSQENAFTDFIRRIRAGDESAAAELVREYESLIRREVRLNLADQNLRRAFDSMDVCQSVLASFFVRTAAGQYDLERPEQLVRLLVTMARNKLVSAARAHRRQRRDHRRAAGGAELLHEVAAGDPTPSEVLAGQELLDHVRRELTDEEQQIAALRGEGLSWEEVAGRLGGAAQARRMQLARALDRAAKALGVEEDADE
jgi:RNA polymerase sigma-70 factor (ECF subfamily)